VPSGDPEAPGSVAPEVHALAAEVCRLLTAEPYLSRLAEALADRLGQAGSAGRGLPPALGDPHGPLPVGPYTVPVEFDEITWDGEPPAQPEWQPAGAGDAPAAAPGPRVPQGPLPGLGPDDD